MTKKKKKKKKKKKHEKKKKEFAITESYTGVAFGGCYAKSGGKTGRKGARGSLLCTYKMHMKLSYW